MSTINARITINTETPIFNQLGFIFKEIKIPIRAPLIDPTITHKAGRKLVSPPRPKYNTPNSCCKNKSK